MPRVVCPDGSEEQYPYNEQGLRDAANKVVQAGCRIVTEDGLELCQCQAPAGAEEEGAVGGLPAEENLDVGMPTGGEVMLPPELGG